jgi:hypothetical protein
MSKQKAYFLDPVEDKTPATSEQSAAHTGRWVVQLVEADLATGNCRLIAQYPKSKPYLSRLLQILPDGRCTVETYESKQSSVSLAFLDVKDLKLSNIVTNHRGSPTIFRLTFGKDLSSALIYVMSRKSNDLWLARLSDLKAVVLCSVPPDYEILAYDATPDLKKICTVIQKSPLGGLFEEDVHFYPAEIFVLDTTKSIADLDGPKSFDIRERLKGEWHQVDPLPAQGMSREGASDSKQSH